MVALAKSLPGFSYGRFDVRVPSVTDLRNGTNLQVLEINGVTSEATNLYDARYSYPEMVRFLLRQWQWSSSIGKHNRLQGHPVASLREIWHALDQYHKRKLPGGSPPS